MLIFSALFLSALNTARAQHWQVYTAANSGLPNDHIGNIGLGGVIGSLRFVVADRHNNVWLISGNQPGGQVDYVVKFNQATGEWKGTADTDITFTQGAGSALFFNLYADKKNNVLLSAVTPSGDFRTYRHTGTQWQLVPELANDEWEYAEDREGYLWTWGIAGGVWVKLLKHDGPTASDKTFMMDGRAMPGPNSWFSDMSFDRSNNFWAAVHLSVTNTSCLVKYRDDDFLPVRYDLDLTTTLINVFTVQEDNDVWVGTVGRGSQTAAGIARKNGSSWVHYNTSNSPLPDNTINVLRSDDLGRLWIGTAAGLARFDEQNEWKVYNTGNVSGQITSIAIDTVGSKWIGTHQGLVKFNEITPAFRLQQGCFGEVSFQDQSSSMEGNITARHWDFGGQGSSTASNPTFTFPVAGEYDVRLWMKDSKGNRNMITQKVTVSTDAVKKNLGDDIQTCQASALITSKFTGADRYTWHTPSGTMEGGSTFTATGSGKYILEATANSGCVLKDTVIVSIGGSNSSTDFTMTLAGKDINSGDVVLSGIPVTFNSAAAQAGATWWFGDNTVSTDATSLHTYEQPGTYTVALTTGNSSCPGRTEKVIEVRDIFITTAISPNGDGKNDKLYIEPFAYEASLKVVDSKGKTVYDAPSYHDDFTGHGLTDGVYFYELRFKEIDRQYKGVVHIIRD